MLSDRCLSVLSVPKSNTRGNKYKLLNHTFHYDLRKYSCSARIGNIWNSLPNTVVDVDTVCLFKARLNKFWMHQVVKYDFTANLTGIGDRSVHDISIDCCSLLCSID